MDKRPVRGVVFHKRERPPSAAVPSPPPPAPASHPAVARHREQRLGTREGAAHSVRGGHLRRSGEDGTRASQSSALIRGQAVAVGTATGTKRTQRRVPPRPRSETRESKRERPENVTRGTSTHRHGLPRQGHRHETTRNDREKDEEKGRAWPSAHRHGLPRQGPQLREGPRQLLKEAGVDPGGQHEQHLGANREGNNEDVREKC